MITPQPHQHILSYPTPHNIYSTTPPFYCSTHYSLYRSTIFCITTLHSHPPCTLTLTRISTATRSGYWQSHSSVGPLRAPLTHKSSVVLWFSVTVLRTIKRATSHMSDLTTNVLPSWISWTWLVTTNVRHHFICSTSQIVKIFTFLG